MSSSAAVLPSQRPKTIHIAFPAVDYCRVVMAFLVLAIHRAPLDSISLAASHFLSEYIARIAVPFFFLCNGFFIFRALRNSAKALKRALRKFARLYLFWTCVYLPFEISRLPAVSLGQKLSFFLRNFFFVGSFIHLWYLFSVFIGLAVLYLLTFVLGLSLNACALPALLLFALGVIGNCYSFLLPPLPASWGISYYYLSRSGIFFGFPFLWLGAWLTEHRPLPGFGVCCTGFLFSMFVGAGEAAFVWQINECQFAPYAVYFFLLPASFFLFCALLQAPVHTHTSTAPLRRFSGAFYFLHMIPRTLYGPVCTKILCYFPTWFLLYHSLFQYCAIAAVSACLSLFVLWLTTLRPFHWLRRVL